MRPLAALVAAALLLLAPASRADSRLEDWYPMWQLAVWNCNDLYDTPTPPAGAVNFASPASWPEYTDGYDLLANRGAPPQTSGSPDGLCDTQLETIKGQFLTDAPFRYFYVRLPAIPPNGVIVETRFLTCPATPSWFYGVAMEHPWDPVGSFPLDLGQVNGTGCPSIPINAEYLGPESVAAGATLQQQDRFPFAATPNHYLWWSAGSTVAGWWNLNMDIYPVRSENTQEPRPQR